LVSRKDYTVDDFLDQRLTISKIAQNGNPRNFRNFPEIRRQSSGNRPKRYTDWEYGSPEIPEVFGAESVFQQGKIRDIFTVSLNKPSSAYFRTDICVFRKFPETSLGKNFSDGFRKPRKIRFRKYAETFAIRAKAS
jgi:hypothetical protein